MTKPNNGGPAFPLPHASHPGMSLRDWFAGQALGCLADHVKTGAIPGALMGVSCWKEDDDGGCPAGC